MDFEQRFGSIISSIWYNFSKRLEEALQEEGIPLTSDQFRLCSMLMDAESVLTQQQIADLLARDRSAITRMIQILEKKKIVSRKQKTDDKRSFIVNLTPYGIELLHQSKSVTKKIINQTYQGFTADEEVASIRYFEKIKSNLSQ